MREFFATEADWMLFNEQHPIIKKYIIAKFVVVKYHHEMVTIMGTNLADALRKVIYLRYNYGEIVQKAETLFEIRRGFIRRKGDA